MILKHSACCFIHFENELWVWYVIADDFNCLLETGNSGLDCLTIKATLAYLVLNFGLGTLAVCVAITDIFSLRY